MWRGAVSVLKDGLHARISVCNTRPTPYIVVLVERHAQRKPCVPKVFVRGSARHNNNFVFEPASMSKVTPPIVADVERPAQMDSAVRRDAVPVSQKIPCFVMDTVSMYETTLHIVVPVISVVGLACAACLAFALAPQNASVVRAAVSTPTTTRRTVETVARVALVMSSVWVANASFVACVGWRIVAEGVSS